MPYKIEDKPEWQMFVDLHAKGMSVADIAVRVGRNPKTILAWRHRLNGTVPAPQKRLTPEEEKIAEQMLDDGASYAEIGRTLGYDGSAISWRFPGRGWTSLQTGQFVSMLRKYNNGYSSQRISSQKYLRAKAYLEQGASIQEAAKNVDCSPTTLQKYFPEYKMDRATANAKAAASKRAKIADQLEEAKHLMDGGMTPYSAAKQVGLSRTTLYRYFPEYKTEVRK